MNNLKKKNKCIVFVLPAITRKISGGYKIVYEFANRLVDHGYLVKIIYDCSNDLIIYRKFYRWAIKFYRNFVCLIEPKWFPLDKRIKKNVVFTLKNADLSQADIVFATAINTAININKLSLDSKKQLFYLIQDYENWDYSDEIVVSTYKYNMRKIVVSRWLREVVYKNSGQHSLYIPNAIDFNVFHIVNPIDSASRKYITFLYHKDERKGCKYAIEIIERIKSIYPNEEFCMFGSIPRDVKIPSYVKYIEKANEKMLLKIYNETKIFVCTSLVEGFGLTGAESMACGATLVTTKTNGSNEYAIDRYNALVSDPKDTDTMVANIQKLLNDENYRIYLAQNGVRKIREFSWENSIQTLIQFIESDCEPYENE